MNRKVTAGEDPWKGGFEVFKRSNLARFDYKPRGPFESAGRSSLGFSLFGFSSAHSLAKGAINKITEVLYHTHEANDDSVAAYQNAIMWVVTGDERHAKKSAEILNAWSAGLKQITGNDRILAAGSWGALFANAAEILRSTYPGWKAGDISRCQVMLHNIFYPVMKDFGADHDGNWDAYCIRGLMAIGVFCDDSSIFNSAVDFFRKGSGNGRLTHYVINDTGQCEESGRDQAHTQLGLGLLCEACQIAWNQGLDLYSAENNRLLKGFEYTAKYNLGNDVPFIPNANPTGNHRHQNISADQRGKFRAVWEMPWNHYHQLCGLEMPYTELVLQKIRPEGAAFLADNPGYGTLLFSVEGKK